MNMSICLYIYIYIWMSHAMLKDEHTQTQTKRCLEPAHEWKHASRKPWVRKHLFFLKGGGNVCAPVSSAREGARARARYNVPWKSNRAKLEFSRHLFVMHVTYVNESCHTFDWPSRFVRRRALEHLAEWKNSPRIAADQEDKKYETISVGASAFAYRFRLYLSLSLSRASNVQVPPSERRPCSEGSLQKSPGYLSSLCAYLSVHSCM